MNRLVFLLLIPLTALSQTYTLSGTVLDAETQQPLPSATLRIAGSFKGTITNMQGQYRFSLPPGRVELAVSYVGYESDTAVIEVYGGTVRTFRLRPAVVQLAGVTVTDEDPAYEIVRRAIESKKKWMTQLGTFEAQAFTRMQLRTDTAIAAIVESYSVLYWNRDDSLREVIVQKRQTGNLPAGMGTTRVGEIMNFNDDKVRQGGFVFTGPTAPDAFDVYEYRLLKTRSLGSYEVYDIQLIPRSDIVPLFKGTISIASRSYAVMDVDLQTNNAYSMPFVSFRKFAFKQSFRLYDDRFWLPVNFRNEARLHVSIMGITLPVIDVEKDIVIYDYGVNVQFHDSIARMNKMTIDSSSAKFDSVFWSAHDVLPLTPEQDTAYRTLDSTQTLEKKFAPSGNTVKALSFMESAGVADFWFNRVEGFHLGVSRSFDSAFVDPLELRGKAGYGVADKEWKYSAGFTYRFGAGPSAGTPGSFVSLLRSRTTFSLSADLYDDHIHLPHVPFAGYFFNSFYALIDKNDYYDYYRSRGAQVSLSYTPNFSLHVTAGIVAEQQYALYQHTAFAWFARGKHYRPHRTIVGGRMNSVRFSGAYNPFGFIAMVKDAFTLNASVEHASPLLSGSFDFTQMELGFRGKVSTMFREELPMPPSLDIYCSIGVTGGALPPQRYFTPESNVLGFTAAGTLRGVRTREFYGDNFITITIEHNFRRMLFSSLPAAWLKESTVEFIVGGTAARYDLTGSTLRSPGFPAAGSNGWYFEAGIGLQNILDVFRIDLTRRFTAPADVVVTLTVSDFFASFLSE